MAEIEHDGHLPWADVVGYGIFHCAVATPRPVVRSAFRLRTRNRGGDDFG